MAGTVVILIFRSFVFENEFVEIFKESRGTVGWALLRDLSWRTKLWPVPS